MATYIKILVDKDGNTILPKTRSSGVYMNDNSTLESKIGSLNSSINGKANTNHVHMNFQEVLPFSASLTNSGTTVESFMGKYTKVLTVNTGSNKYSGSHIVFMIHDMWEIGNSALLMLRVRSNNPATNFHHCHLECLWGSEEFLQNQVKGFLLVESAPIVTMYYKSMSNYRNWRIQELYSFDATNGTHQWYTYQPYVDVLPSGNIHYCTYPKSGSNDKYTELMYRSIQFVTATPTSLTNGAICLVYQ